ncbi:ankyrin repeat-containing domain protein [Lactarius pseudohatsudake]|nr:ankyrin repeat-containing domain protein [Lactarius pseudohatsudake]
MNSVADVLYMFSGTLGGVAGVVCLRNDLIVRPNVPLQTFLQQGPYLLDNEVRPLHKTTYGKYGFQDGVRVARLLQERGMDTNRIRNDQCRPLRVASYCGKLGVVQLLLERGTRVDVEVASKRAIPLHWGEYESREDDTHLGRLLLERDLDVSARGEEKWTPLHAASYYGKPEIVRPLLDRGAEAIAEADNGDTWFRVVNTNPRKMVSALPDYYWSAAQT